MVKQNISSIDQTSSATLETLWIIMDYIIHHWIHHSFAASNCLAQLTKANHSDTSWARPANAGYCGRASHQLTKRHDQNWLPIAGCSKHQVVPLGAMCNTSLQLCWHLAPEFFCRFMFHMILAPYLLCFKPGRAYNAAGGQPLTFRWNEPMQLSFGRMACELLSRAHNPAELL